MTDHVRIDTQDGVLTLTLARPDKKNALTDPMYGALADALEAAEKDDAVRVVLLLAEGDAFCAGSDVNEFMKVATGEIQADDRQVFRFLAALAAARKPYVAGVRGLAVGIGMTMLLHFDLVYMAEDAKLSAPFVNLGLGPEAASSLLLPAVIGHRRAFALFTLGERIDGREAAALGLANAALPADEVDVRAAEAARALARRAPGSVQLTKTLMRDAEALQARIDAESAAFKQRLMSAEAKEAFTAFMERRPPVF
jgi:enoyl-CoA hydratase/carnithine racemase